MHAQNTCSGYKHLENSTAQELIVQSCIMNVYLWFLRSDQLDEADAIFECMPVSAGAQ